MLTIHTVPEAIGLMLAGILLLGTWPAVWHQVEQTGRLPSHTFLDYALTYLVFATTAALTLGQLGPPAFSAAGQSLQFFDQLQQLQQQGSSNWTMVLFALAGGICLALGDLALQYSIAMCGLSVGPPILNSITLIVGVVLAYFLDGGINKPQLVFSGAAFAALAVAVGAAAHVVRQREEQQRELQEQQQGAVGCCERGGNKAVSGCSRNGSISDRTPEDSAHGSAGASGLLHHRQQVIASELAHRHCSSSNTSSTPLCHSFDAADAVMQCDDGGGGDDVTTAKCGSSSSSLQADCELGGVTTQQQLSSVDQSACGPQQQQQQQQPPSPPPLSAQPLQQRKQQLQRSVTASRRASLYLGLAITVVGGVIYGCFLPLFQIAANDPFRLLPPPTPPLSVYTTFFYFAVGFTALSAIVNTWLMYRPPLGIQASNLTAYLRDNRGRGLSVASGLLAAAGDLTQFLGGQTAGYAAAMMVMAYPVVGVLWGCLRFRELRRGGGGKKGSGGSSSGWWWCGVSPGVLLVVAQVVLYVLSVGLLSGSAELRHTE